jgi:hypothetical protein
MRPELFHGFTALRVPRSLLSKHRVSRIVQRTLRLEWTIRLETDFAITIRGKYSAEVFGAIPDLLLAFPLGSRGGMYL